MIQNNTYFSAGELKQMTLPLNRYDIYTKYLTAWQCTDIKTEIEMIVYHISQIDFCAGWFTKTQSEDTAYSAIQLSEPLSTRPKLP